MEHAQEPDPGDQHQPARGLRHWSRLRIERIRSHYKDFFAVVETVPIGIRVQSVGSDRLLLHVEETIAIHVGNRADGIAAFEGRAIEFLSGDTCLDVAKRDSSFLNPEVRRQIREAVAVQVLEVRPMAVVERCTAGSEGQRGHIDVCHVKAIRPEERHRKDTRNGAGGIDSYPIESFTGPAKAIDVSHLPTGRNVTKDMLEDQDIEPGDIVLIYTAYVPLQTETACRNR